MTHIVNCRVENIKGVKEVEFKPEGKSVTIGGGNGQGKSSAIEGLIMALAGANYVPTKPVREGAESGEIIVETEKYIISRTFTADGKTKLSVTSPEGAKYSSPQQLLNACFGTLSFEPGAFIRMDKHARLKTLRELVKVDFSDLDEKEKSLYEMRRDCGYEVKSLTAKLDSVEINGTLPDEEVSVSDLTSKLEAENKKHEDARRLQASIDSLASVIAASEHKIKELKADIRDLEDVIAEAEKNRKTISDTVTSIVLVDTQPLLDEIAKSSDTNAKIRSNRDAKATRDCLKEAQGQHEKLEKEIDSVRAERVERLSQAQFPIDGLSFSDDGVTFNSIPFEQLSESEKWEISTAIGFALSPQGVLFVSNSGGLDKNSRQRIRERAEKLGVQLFLEVVDDAEDVQILIEEGQIKENRL